MTKPLDSATPHQIGSIVNVDRMDTIDRAKLDPTIKFQLLCAEAKATHGRDPRSGGFAFVARPRVMRQLLIDLNVGPLSSSIVRLQRAVVVATSRTESGADFVGWWSDVPLVVRCTVVNDSLWVLPLERIPPSKPVDRNTAGRIRMAVHYGKLAELGDN